MCSHVDTIYAFLNDIIINFDSIIVVGVDELFELQLNL